MRSLKIALFCLLIFGLAVPLVLAQEEAKKEAMQKSMTSEVKEEAAAAVPAAAEEVVTQEQGAKELEPIEETKSISGKIISLDAANSTLVVKEEAAKDSEIAQELTFNTDDLTVIDKDYEEVSLSNLAVGDEVAVEYIVDKDGKNIASYIELIIKE